MKKEKGIEALRRVKGQTISFNSQHSTLTLQPEDEKVDPKYACKYRNQYKAGKSEEMNTVTLLAISRKRSFSEKRL